MKTIGLFLMLFLGLVVTTTQAQMVGSRIRVELTSGTVVVGTVQTVNEAEISLRTAEGVTVTIPRTQIRRFTDIGTGRFDRADPTPTRFFLMPTARTLRPGSIRFTAYEIFFPSVAVGLTPWLDGSIGVTIIPASPSQVASLSLKAAPVQQENLSVAIGGTTSTVVGDIDEIEGVFVGTLYGLATIGSSDRAVTAGVIFPYGASIETEDLEISNTPILMLGGELQMSNSIKLLSENYFVPRETIGLVSAGIRFFGERLSGDFGGLIPYGPAVEEVYVLPWIGISYNIR